jgi:hypothetical protein
VFLQRYIDAFDARRRGIATTAVWRAAFDAAASDRLCVIQHLLLGMNAHINFDLAIAATDALDRDELHAFHGDFERMNALLASLVDEVSADIALFWPLLKWVTRIARRPDDVIIDFSMRCARRHAWGDAMKLAALSGSARREAEAHLDVQASALAREIAQPPGATRLVTRLIRWSERGSVDGIIGDLLRRRPIKIFSGG